jgi:anti-sigma B factor antagonist
MELSERQVSGVTVIDVAGDLIVTDNPCAVKEFVKAILQRGDRRIVLNVGAIRRVDSTCLGEIIASYTTTTVHGGVLKLAQPDRHLLRLLELTRLNTIIDVFHSEAEAVASFGGAGSGVT